MEKDKFAPEGIFCAMITPFDDNGAVDIEQTRAIVRFLIQKNVDGVFPVSNVGEFLLLSMDERKELIKAVLDEGRGKIRVIPGISDLSIENCLKLAEFSRGCGADGVVVCAPFYYPYSQQYVIEFLKHIADHSPLPVTLYNSPLFANKVDFDLLVELCMHQNVTAIKESSGDVKFLLKLKVALDKNQAQIRVMLGWEELLYTGLSLGCDGCIVSSAGIVPELLVGIRDCFLKGEVDRALQLQKDVVEIAEAVKRFGFPHGYKLGVLSRGFNFNLFKGKSFDTEECRLRNGLSSLKLLIDDKLHQYGFSEVVG